MAGIPGLEQVGFTGFNWANIWAKTLLGLEIVGGLVAFGLAFYFFILKRSRYKDFIEIIDFTTNQKQRDRGYLKTNRDGSQEYKLLKNKKAELDEPPESVFVTKKGNKIRQLVKYGPGDFNWASALEVWDKDKKAIHGYHITNLTDQNWNKDKIRRAAEKKHSQTGLKQYIPQIMVGAVIVMFIISAWFITGVMKQSVTIGTSTIDKGAEIAAQNAQTASVLAGISRSGGSSSAPPPDI